MNLSHTQVGPFLRQHGLHICCQGHVHLSEQQRWQWERDLGIHFIQGWGRSTKMLAVFGGAIDPKFSWHVSNWLILQRSTRRHGRHGPFEVEMGSNELLDV